MPKTLAAPPAGIREAYRRMTAHDPGPFAVPAPHHHLEQTHHGTTDAALAAWYECRPGFRDKVHEVFGVPDYRVADMDGHRTIRTPALVIVRQGGLRLHLTGCSWGYGGEGPHGTALILVDLGLFADVASAMPFVGSRPESWSGRVSPLVVRPPSGPWRG